MFFKHRRDIPGSPVPRAKRRVTALQPPDDAPLDPVDPVDPEDAVVAVEAAAAADEEPVAAEDPPSDPREPRPPELEPLELLLSPLVKEPKSKLPWRCLMVLEGTGTMSIGAAAAAMARAKRRVVVRHFIMAEYLANERLGRR